MTVAWREDPASGALFGFSDNILIVVWWTKDDNVGQKWIYVIAFLSQNKVLKYFVNLF